MKDATPPWIQSKSTVPCNLDLCMQLYRYKSEIAEFELNIFWLSNQIFFVGDLNIFSLVQHNIHGSPGVCGLSPVLRSLHATVHPPTCRFPRRSPSRQPSPRQGRLESSSVGLSVGRSLTQWARARRAEGPVVRWWGGWLVTRPVMQVETVKRHCWHSTFSNWRVVALFIRTRHVLICNNLDIFRHGVSL